MKSRSLWIDNQPVAVFGDDIGAFYYEERALLAAKPGDIVIVDYEIEPRYLYQLRKIVNYRLVGLICLQNRYCDLVESIHKWERLDLLQKYVNKKDYIIRSYIPDERISLLSQYLKIEAKGIRFYETNRSQLDLMIFLNKMKLNTIETLSLNKSNIEDVLDFFKENKCILSKPTFSIGGKGIVEISKITELKEFYKSKNSGMEYVLQRKMKANLEGSIQFLFEDGRFHIYVCRTYNPNNSYSGFSYPCKTKALDRLKIDAENMLAWFTQKYKGDLDSFGVDFIISDEKIFYHDLNARKTSVSYVLSFLKRINSNFEKCENFRTICLHFSIKKNVLYNELQTALEMSDIPDLAEKGEGLMIINPGTINIGLVQVVSVSYLNREKEYLEKFQKQLKEKGVEFQWLGTVIQSG